MDSRLSPPLTLNTANESGSDAIEPAANAHAAIVLEQDEVFMRLAMGLADRAEQAGEVPVGSLVVRDNQVIGRGYNRSITTCDPSAHAEIVALRAAAATAANYRLPDTTLYVTLEPCMMCVGAILHARVNRVVFAARDPKTGACGSALNLPANASLNHQTQFVGGVLEDEAAEQLRQFFRRKRAENAIKSKG